MRTWRNSAVVAATLLLAMTASSNTSAQQPSPGLDFSIGIDVDGDSTDECNTGTATTTCRLPLDSTFTVSVYLNSLPDVVLAYDGFDVVIWYFGVDAGGRANASAWPDCGFEASFFSDTIVALGCAIGIPPAGPSNYTGGIGTVDFDCIASGTLALVHGRGRTALVDENNAVHQEGGDTETLTIECGDPPVPPPPADVHGNADCDDKVTSLDALIILQFNADLLDSLPCPRNADVWKNGGVGSLDALAVLQFVAGLIDRVPALGPLPP